MNFYYLIILPSLLPILLLSNQIVESIQLKNANNVMTGNDSTSAGTIFDVPSNIDEDELLHEIGLFTESIMNFKMDPCENFYEYACGNWPYSQRVPIESRSGAMLKGIALKIDELIIKYLKTFNDTDLKQPQQQYNADMKAKIFFNSCLKDLQNPKDLKSEFKRLLDETDAIFDKTDKSDKTDKTDKTDKVDKMSPINKLLSNRTNDDWIRLNFISPYGIRAFLPINVTYNFYTRRYEIFIELPEPVLNSYDDLTKLRGLNLDMGKDIDHLKMSLDFERNLTSKVHQLKIMERVTMKQFLQNHFNDSIKWGTVFNVGFDGRVMNDWYVNNNIANFTDLERFLRKSNPIAIRCYLKWRTILKFYKIWQDSYSVEKMDKRCLLHTTQYFTYALMPWYSSLMFDDKRREDALITVDALRKHFKISIGEAKWLDEETKSHMLSKISTMDIAIGYTDKMHHSYFSDMAYQNVNVTNNWFRNVVLLEAFRNDQTMKSVHQIVLPVLMSPYNVNAYYATFMNQIFAPIGIFQMPFYHISMPSSLKYSGIGVLIAHEMVHSLDTKSYTIDYDGKMVSHWSEAALRNFRERYECFKNQYSKFIYGGVATNASLTLNENLADNSGAHLAYNAYMEEAGRFEGTLQPLPGSNFTNNQLFFIKLAQTWCVGYKGSSKIPYISEYDHTYEEFRTIGILQNMPQFSEVFQCKLGTEMNPSKKCTLW